jgi:hypothetical protein
MFLFTFSGVDCHRVCGFVACLAIYALLGISPAIADEDSQTDSGSSNVSGTPYVIVPDIRGEKVPLKVEKGDLVAVPIPTSSPTFGTGLVAGAAYFYPQTEEQKSSQSASFTGLGGMYTDNESWVAAIAQQSYWDEDKWRFFGVAGYADFKFVLRDPVTEGETGVNWGIEGGLFQGTLSRRIADSWYLGLLVRYLDITQDIETSLPEPPDGTDSEITSAGAGLTLEYDSRDVPTNAYSGSRFETKAIFSQAKGLETSSYQSYYLRMRRYHKLNNSPIVIAWDVYGCSKGGKFPLWDTCRLNLRGFSMTDYLGDQSISAQVEARWQASKRWGFVVFGGAGHVSNSFSARGEDERVPSYGAGVRFMVLGSKRVNLRVDYAQSNDNEAWYISVGEAF